MRLSILFSITFFLLSSNTFSKIWILDTNPSNLAKDFTSLQAAHDSPSVLSGDTLYLCGFNIGYGSLTLTKQLHIFGPGYYLTENVNTQANPYPATIGYITFNSGSEGSSISGCSSSPITINTNSITIERNYITSSDPSSISINNVNNIIIKQNYINGAYYSTINITGNSNNIYVRNNYIHHYAGGYGAFASSASCTNIILDNNVLDYSISLHNGSITNNILTGGGYSGSNNSVQFNICNGTQFPDNGTNQLNVNISTVFLGTGSTDGKWQLAPGSPAIGTGVGGTDIGMYGGVDPYLLSGIPPIPTIYQFFGSNAGTQSLPVQLKIKSRQ